MSRSVLFVHQNYPAQFGHVARGLVRERGYRCAFLSLRPPGNDGGVERAQYAPVGGATANTHYCARTFENAVAHAHGAHEAAKRLAEGGFRPDLIVGHSGFGSTLFLREVFSCPVLNYFEYYYHPRDSDLDFRPEFPPSTLDVLRSYCRNAMILLDLENCDRGQAPTHWQRSLFPERARDKIEVVFDGVDTRLWRRDPRPRTVLQPSGDPASGSTSAPIAIPVPRGPRGRVVTYVSRGFESMRGFDVFMKVAKRIYLARPDTLFLVVGTDRVAYGGDLKYIPEKSFREHVLKQDDYDLSKFLFTGHVPPAELANLLSLSHLHIYLTVPFVLSWSLVDALACGTVVVASDTPPVRELIAHGRNGLLAGFFDVDRLAELALQVLDDPPAHQHLAEAGVELVRNEYSLDVCLPRILDLYERTIENSPPKRPISPDNPNFPAFPDP